MDSWIRNQEEVFGRGLNLGQQREQERIIKLLEKHEWFEKGEQDTILGILDGTYECNCGCLELIKGEQK